MFLPPPISANISVATLLDVVRDINVVTMISPEMIYWISALLPFVLMPLLLPMVVLMARRKGLTDHPSARKLQERPVAVMGGTVMVLVLCITMVIINLFYAIDEFFPAMCVMVIMFIFGLLDDSIGLSWQFKFVVQIGVVSLLFFAGNYGVYSLYGLFGIGGLPMWLSYLLTVYAGLLLLNGVNFIDGIDGLASGLGVLTGAVMGVWNIGHGFITQAIVSFVFVGIMLAFFFFNVFSKRYKMYMGDSGSLVLGFFIFISACPDTFISGVKLYVIDSYFVSFTVALLSAVIFDLVRVAALRLMHGHSPFLPDRTHLHHVFVDCGMSHLMTTLTIVFLNIVVLALWFVTARTGMNITVQFFLTLLFGVVFLWGPYFMLSWLRDRYHHVYFAISRMNETISSGLDKIGSLIGRILDGPRARRITHRIK